MRFSNYLIAAAGLLALAGSPLAGRDYCLSPQGDDSAAGTADAPWRTLGNVNATRFEPGDRILLAGATPSPAR